jgi:RNA polymerase sigma factor (sigma-70 family)
MCSTWPPGFAAVRAIRLAVLSVSISVHPWLNPPALTSESSSHHTAALGDIFATTHWSVVLAAGKHHTGQSDHALATLCQTYWHPLYTYVRRRGYSPHDAEDLTQEFFARILARNDVAGVSPARGKFRSYLLAAINHFLSDEWDKARAQKRGGGQVIHLDSAVAESVYAQEHGDRLAPERLFDQRWGITVLEEVHQQLRKEYERDGKSALFEALRFALMGERSAVPYADLADKLNLSEAAVKVAVHRLRRRYRQVLREVVAGTVSSPDEVEEEMRYLLRAVSATGNNL